MCGQRMEVQNDNSVPALEWMCGQRGCCPGTDELMICRDASALLHFECLLGCLDFTLVDFALVTLWSPRSEDVCILLELFRQGFLCLFVAAAVFWVCWACAWHNPFFYLSPFPPSRVSTWLEFLNLLVVNQWRQDLKEWSSTFPVFRCGCSVNIRISWDSQCSVINELHSARRREGCKLGCRNVALVVIVFMKTFV